MRTFRTVPVALTGVALAVTLAACGSSGGGNTPTLDATGSTGGSPSSATGALPTAAELDATLTALIDARQSAASRARNVVGGEDIAGTLTQLDTVVKRVGQDKIVFDVQKITKAGTLVSGSVKIVSQGRPFDDLYPAVWQQAGSSWQLTRAGACSVMTAGGVSCPGAAAK